jgi:hypothetical protein
MKLNLALKEQRLIEEKTRLTELLNQKFDILNYKQMKMIVGGDPSPGGDEDEDNDGHIIDPK